MSSTDLALATPAAVPQIGRPAQGPPDAHEWALLEKQARAFANSGLVRRELNGRWEAVLLIALTGRDYGLSPTVALRNIYVVDGQPSMSANLIAALIRRDGHRIGIDEKRSNHLQAVAVCQRWEADGWGEEHELTWTLEEAKNARLYPRKDNWRDYPAAMLRARALSAIGRLWFQDTLLGTIYTPDELGAIESPQGSVIVPAGKRAAAERAASSPLFQEPGQPAAEDEIVDAEVEPDYPPVDVALREIDEIAALFGQTRRALTRRWAVAFRRNIEDATPRELHDFLEPWRQRAAEHRAANPQEPGPAASSSDVPASGTAVPDAGTAQGDEIVDAEIPDAEVVEPPSDVAAGDEFTAAEQAHARGEHAAAVDPDCPTCAGL